jgi:uncharacterized protein
MLTLTKYYKFSMLFAVVAVALGFFLWGPEAAFIIAVLGILETSLSFDNAVVNARVLQNWDEVWKKRFLFWGILVAVFGMRIVFPLAIVSVTTGLGPIEATTLALDDPDEYSRLITAVHHQVAGFGGAFLFMVALAFFFEEKHVYWLEAIEHKLARLGKLEGVAAAVTLVISYLVSKYYDNPVMGTEFFIAAVLGVVTFIIAHGLGSLLGTEDDDEDEAESKANLGGVVIKAGLAGFLYLEILDASFSFDGVIAAFVLSNYLPIIALGLGIGAFFVRSMTIHLVDAGTLSEYRFLEHGAFYAIFALAGIMYASGLGLHLPEWLVGLMSIMFIFAALWRSIVHNRRDAVASIAS